MSVSKIPIPDTEILTSKNIEYIISFNKRRGNQTSDHNGGWTISNNYLSWSLCSLCNEVRREQ
jgi:hypothetical protein